jgi:hypothetical protein
MTRIKQHNKQLTDFEFDMLARSGSATVEVMIRQRVRLCDTGLNSESLVDDALDYVYANARDSFYIQRGYHSLTVYFISPLDWDNFSNLIASYSQN